MRDQKTEIQKKKVIQGRRTKLDAPFFTKSGTRKGMISLPTELFGIKPSEKTLAQYIYVYLARQRKAHAKTKSRGEISISKAKIQRQKGMGRARHGARSAPIFVGGGIAHGPRGMANYKLSISKKMVRHALLSALAYQALQNKVLVGDLEGIEPRTKKFIEFVKRAAQNQKITLVHSGDKNLILSARNLKNVFLIPANQLNAYDVLRGDVLLFTKQGLEVLTKRYA